MWAKWEVWVYWSSEEHYCRVTTAESLLQSVDIRTMWKTLGQFGKGALGWCRSQLLISHSSADLITQWRGQSELSLEMLPKTLQIHSQKCSIYLCYLSVRVLIWVQAKAQRREVLDQSEQLERSGQLEQIESSEIYSEHSQNCSWKPYRKVSMP